MFIDANRQYSNQNTINSKMKEEEGCKGTARS